MGFLANVPVLSAAEAILFRERFESIEAHEKARRGGHWQPRDYLPVRMKHHPLRDWFVGLAAHPRVGDVVESILGPDIMILGGSVFIKEPQTSRGVVWHADVRRPGEFQRHALRVWIWLSPSTDSNGCLKLFPATHGREFPHRNRNGSWAVSEEALEELGEDRCYHDQAQPGEMTLLSHCLIHSSGQNRSADRRFAFSVNYASPQIANHLPGGISGVLIRGANRVPNVSTQAEFDVTWEHI